MTTLVRRLDPARDLGRVADLLRRSADYVAMERGSAETDGLAEAFFADSLPGGHPSLMVKLGLFDEDSMLAGIADMGFGFPEPADAYLGLIQLAEDSRGQGLGTAFLRQIEKLARERGAKRLLVAVLNENPRGRAFWEREGFVALAEDLAVTLGDKAHKAARMAKAL